MTGTTDERADDDGLDAAPVRLLSLLRHGRAAPATAELDDHERPLVASGRDDVARTLGAEAVRAEPPDRVLCSTARRTIETALVALDALGLDETVLARDRRLYLASPEAMLEIVAEQDALGLRHLMIVGHNPGLEMLASELDARSMASLPTSGLCRFARRTVAAASGESGRPGASVARLLFETRPG